MYQLYQLYAYDDINSLPQTSEFSLGQRCKLLTIRPKFPRVKEK